MPDYINRGEFLAAFPECSTIGPDMYKRFAYGWNSLRSEIKAFKSADAVNLVTGTWKIYPNEDEKSNSKDSGGMVIWCSNCFHSVNPKFVKVDEDIRFCSCCGSKMSNIQSIMKIVETYVSSEENK